VIGGGVVLDPLALIEETEAIEKIGTKVAGRLFVSNRCHLILPYHRVLETAIELQLGERKIGTTSRGIGPAYEDKMGRRGLRMCDLIDTGTLCEKIRQRVDEKNRQLDGLRYPQIIDPEPICDAYIGYAEALRPLVVDAAVYLNRLIAEHKSILFEGAQATLLDVDHGTFPYVTSSSAAAGGAATGLGVAPKHVHSVIGITKAYATRVGAGPFPTECDGSAGEELRHRGVEFGSTTGRPRRCGWFDGPSVRYSTMINSTDSIAVTKLDVLDTFSEIPFCVDYKYKGSVLKEFPADIEVLGKVEPVFKNLPGWRTSIASTREWSKLPSAAQDYLKFMSDYLNTPISMVSTGAGRDETIHV
jgi:adenylosuccinate synthase